MQPPTQTQPTVQPTTATQPTALDPQIVNLTKAIRQTESGGNFQAVGKSGEYGAYQFEPDTWNATASKYGVNVPLQQATPEQQNEVAYKQVAEWKSQGYNVGQIASMWNAGAGKPNAYLEGNAGTNSYGASYDTAAYAKEVATNYQTYKSQTAQPTGNGTPAPDDSSPSVGGFLNNVVSSAGNVLSGLGTAIMHPIKTLETLGNTAAGAVENVSNATGVTDFNNNQTQTADNVGEYFKNRYGGSNPNEVFHNIVKSAYTDPVGVALDLSTLLTGAGGALGVAGKLGDLSKVATAGDLTDVAKIGDVTQTLGKTGQMGEALTKVGNLINPIAPVTGAVNATVNKLSDLTDAIPRRIINNLLPQLKKPATLDYATDNLKLGSVGDMIDTSKQAMNSYSSQVDSILTHPDYAGSTVDGAKIVASTLDKFPNSEYTVDGLLSKIKSQVPGSAALVTKLQNGSLSLDEANTLRQAIDQVTYKTIIDSPEIKAGKDLANAFANNLRDAVKTAAPETVPVFSDWSKEINLNKALLKLEAKEGKASAVSMKELLGAFGATGVFGPIGGAATLIGEKLADTPLARVGLAKAVKSLSPAAKATAGAVSKVSPYLKEASMAGRVDQASN